MRDFKSKVAVITGAASGMGKCMAERFAAEGMRIVLADVEAAPLAAAEAELRGRGHTVLAVQTDVSKAEQVERLAARTMETFGAVNLLCNNAGVVTIGYAWTQRRADWEWTLAVNLWGVIYGVQTFVPLMMQNGEDGHIVNTASLAGWISMPFQVPYNASKYAVVGLSEGLHRELALAQSRIKVSVLCPGFVHTRIMEAERNRPVELPVGDIAEAEMHHFDVMRAGIAAGIDPKVVAQMVFEAVRDERFYIITDPELWKPLIQERMEDVLNDRNPQLRKVD